MNQQVEQELDGDFLQEFFGAAEEQLDALETTLIQLEAQGLRAVAAGVIGQLSGLLQELKNGAGFLGLQKFFTLVEAGEPVLAALISGAIQPTTPVVDGLLQLTATLKDLLLVHKAQGDEATIEIAELKAELAALARGEIYVLEPEAVPRAVVNEARALDSVVTACKPVVAAAKVKIVKDAALAEVMVGPVLLRQASGETGVPLRQLDRRLHRERRQGERRDSGENGR